MKLNLFVATDLFQFSIFMKLMFSPVGQCWTRASPMWVVLKSPVWISVWIIFFDLFRLSFISFCFQLVETAKNRTAENSNEEYKFCVTDGFFLFISKIDAWFFLGANP